MKYSLLVTSAPCSGHTSLTAARFTAAVLARGHSVHRVFFLDAGTLNGSAAGVSPQGETDPRELWQALAQTHGVELILCISSALREGVLDVTEANRHEKLTATAHPAFTVSGLGQLIDAWVHSDRVVTFGG